MVRISDILKHKGQVPEPDKDKKKEEEAVEQEPQESQETEGKAASSIQISKAMAGGQPEAEKEMQVAKAMHEMQLDPEESRRIYEQALAVIKEIFNQAQLGGPLELTEAKEIIQIMVDRLVLGDKELIVGAGNYSEDYLYGHSVNVSIYSIDMGLALGYNKSKLNQIGLGAFLHDIGMTYNNITGIAKQPHKLNEREYTEIKKHPNHVSGILEITKGIEEDVACIIKQHHERLDGTGYPNGLKDNQIHEYAQVVAIVDVYEALTHPRNYREAFSPHEALKELLALSVSRLFQTRLIKVWMNRIGLYPVGSWIELNTGEIGKVIVSNNDFPLRPKVNIIFGPDKEKLTSIKSVDLSRHANIFIKRNVNPKELDLKLE